MGKHSAKYKLDYRDKGFDSYKVQAAHFSLQKELLQIGSYLFEKSADNLDKETCSFIQVYHIGQATVVTETSFIIVGGEYTFVDVIVESDSPINDLEKIILSIKGFQKQEK